MGFAYKPVTLDEYNQCLREAVNVYYTHALNNSNMSKEEALKSAGEMAEKYLGAVEEFQETQSIQTQASSMLENNAEVIPETSGVTGSENVENHISAGNIVEDNAVNSVSEESSVFLSGDEDLEDNGEACEEGLDW